MDGLYILGLSKGIEVGLGAYKDNQDQPSYVASANIGLHQIVYNRELEGVIIIIIIPFNVLCKSKTIVGQLELKDLAGLCLFLKGITKVF